MPRLRESTLDAHRSAVRSAILDATAALVGRGGLRAVTMSQVAADADVGRATLYRYFTDVDALLLAWHERQLSEHLHHLAGLTGGTGAVGDRLAAALSAFASIRHRHPGGGEVAPLHGGGHVTMARGHVRDLLSGLLEEGAAVGAVRGDVPPAELAGYCLAALEAAAGAASDEAVERLVGIVLASLRPSA